MKNVMKQFDRTQIAVPLAIPLLLTTDIARAQKTYQKIGFTIIGASPHYIIMRGFGCELHMSEVSHIPKPDCIAAYLRIADVEAVYQAFQLHVPALQAPVEKPWGLREFHWIDEDGNLLNIGQILP